MKAPLVPVSWGELIDKITILEQKEANIRNPAALKNVRRELELLSGIAAAVVERDAVLRDQKRRIAEINRMLWDIEDAIREKEAAQSFDAEFIRLARSVYETNDRRAAVKREINDHLGSELVEEKSYSDY